MPNSTLAGIEEKKYWKSEMRRFAEKLDTYEWYVDEDAPDEIYRDAEGGRIYRQDEIEAFLALTYLDNPGFRPYAPANWKDALDDNLEFLKSRRPEIEVTVGPWMTVEDVANEWNVEPAVIKAAIKRDLHPFARSHGTLLAHAKMVELWPVIPALLVLVLYSEWRVALESVRSSK